MAADTLNDKRNQQQEGMIVAQSQSGHVLLKLPGEIRNMIFKSIIEDLDTDACTYHLEQRRTTAPHPISATCRQIREEFLPLFYSCQRFWLDIHGDDPAKARTEEWLEAIRPHTKLFTTAFVWIDLRTGITMSEIGISTEGQYLQLTIGCDLTSEKKQCIGEIVNKNRRRAGRTRFNGCDIVALTRVLTGKGITYCEEWYSLTVATAGRQQWRERPELVECLNEEGSRPDDSNWSDFDLKWV